MQVVEITDEDEPIQKQASRESELTAQEVLANDNVIKEEVKEQKEVVNELFDKKNGVGYPDITVHSASLTPITFWAISVIVAAVIIGTGLIVMSRGQGNIKLNFAGSPASKISPEPSGQPTPTVIPALVKQDINVEVLNGSGKAGVASVMKKFLQEKGYTVVGTGNASRFDYSATEISVKPGKEQILDALKTDLSGSYTVGTVSATLDASASYDALVIAGKE